MNRFFLVIHITFMLISCGKQHNSTQKSILKYNSPTGITSLDPAFARTQENVRAVNQLFNGLVELDSNLLIRPALAQSWQISADAKTYTFIIRTGVLFHNHSIFDGEKRTVSAHDFVYSFNRLINPKTASDGAWIFNGIVASETPFRALNDSTLQINLKQPFAPLLSMLSMAYCFVVPKEAVEFFGVAFGKNPVGTGPFQFANWADGIKLNLVKNESYYQSTKETPIPLLDAISISFIQSKQTELLEFAQGKLDLFTGLESSYKDEILYSNGSLKSKYAKFCNLQKSPFLNTEYLAFNMQDTSSPVYDIHFRKALSYAINREEMIKHLRNNIGRPADGGFSPVGLASHSKSFTPLYNQQKAREQLALSKIKQTTPLILTTTRDYLDLCILVQKNCAEVGVTVKIEVVPSSLLKQQKSAGELAFFRSSWIADYPDGENYMACFYGPNKAPNGPNYTRFQSAKFDRVYTQLLSETDPKILQQLFETMEQILAFEQPFIVLFYDESIWLRSKKVRDVYINSLNHLDLRNAYFK
jgi:ABC-type transport system substrate-binding protein